MLPGVHFPADQTDALLHAIRRHDDVDLSATLPDAIGFDDDPFLIDRCYRLCVQLWRDIEPGLLARLAARFARGGRLDPEAMRAFKDVRARAKQLRFAYATLGEGHAYPSRLDRMTRLMGKLQDAARAGRRGEVALRGMVLRLMATRIGAASLLREADGFRAASPAGLRAHLLAEIERIGITLREPEISNQRFHETRKVVSRMVAFYDTLTVLAPSAEHRAIDRYLATINGLMGGLHDEMVVRKAASRADYLRLREPLPPEIARRLARLVEVFGRGLAMR